MKSSMRNMCQLGLLLALVIARLGQVNGAGECGIVSADIEALTLAPCVSAAQDMNVAVSSSCCDAVQTLIKNPACLCAVLLSNTAKSSGVNLDVAITIPKRCNIADRPVGYQCGAYTLP
ncbi:hypothetical protein E3N88_13610 [Mikania micrantha]|uniref:Bifunctional inhibitor/plant lipid transfer protein/seed storage helical domain-containing protein n=1 Tax=Mikania micrantha TaxID=192012 RepID=A0A5N6P8X2_9ASTR|nr:hypothetical protein E3N88_13610 [Mikania micrantha]